ncbi:hypothetical protein JYJ95_02275 [Corallococcus exiguus]|uniref:PDZ domain-containing protein n=1 Tax=Corallococcus exiguus TaxID=83462 RepID=UPI001A8E5500|nr:PDZ domain-containing protein [Corallococcus exiguus]MBN8465320.1 hypothetical protein [Corallococcus exiguus]
MFLASLLSAFAGAWVFAAAPFTVTMKSAGYSARSDGETVTVTQVEPKSVAAKAGLQPGMQVKRIDMPPRAFIKVPLAQLDAADLQDALTPQPAESLWLKVDPHPKGTTQVILQSREPLPANMFPNVPLTEAQLERLTPMQFGLYHGRLQMAFVEQQDQPRLEIKQDTTAYVMKGKLVGVEGGGATSLWLHPSLDVRTTCRTGLETLEVSGKLVGFDFTLRPEDARHDGEPVAVTPAFWPVPAVLRQCDGSPKPLERPVHVKLICKGKPPLERDVNVKLTVRCDTAAPMTRQPLYLREPWDFMVGDKTPLQVQVSAHQLIPRPMEATLVEVDAEGQVTRRLRPPLPIGKNARESSLQVDVPLDTTVARTVRLAMEARFSDGSTWISEPQTREIRSPAQRDADDREAVESFAKLEAFQKRLAAKFKDPCADLPATMKWMDVQPDLEYASAEEDGHSFAYKVKGARAPLIFSCHRHR